LFVVSLDKRLAFHVAVEDVVFELADTFVLGVQRLAELFVDAALCQRFFPPESGFIAGDSRQRRLRVEPRLQSIQLDLLGVALVANLSQFVARVCGRVLGVLLAILQVRDLFLQLFLQLSVSLLLGPN